MPLDATVPQTDDLLGDIIRAGNPSHIVIRVAALMAEGAALERRREADRTRKAEERARAAQKGRRATG